MSAFEKISDEKSKKTLMDVAKEVSKDAKKIFDQEDETYEVFKDHVRKNLKFKVDEVQIRALFQSLDANHDGHIGNKELAAFMMDEKKKNGKDTDTKMLKAISEIRVKQAVELANQELALQEQRSETVIERMKEQCIESLKKASDRVKKLRRENDEKMRENKKLKQKIKSLEKDLKTQTKKLKRESASEKADAMQRILKLERENAEFKKERKQDGTMAKAWNRIQSLEVENAELRSSLVQYREKERDYVEEDENMTDDVQRLTRRILTMSASFDQELQSQQDRYERLEEIHDHLKRQFGETLDETTRTLESLNAECRRLRVVEKAFHVYVHDERERMLRNDNDETKKMLSLSLLDDHATPSNNNNASNDSEREEREEEEEDVRKSLFRLFCSHANTDERRTSISINAFTRIMTQFDIVKRKDADSIKAIFRETSHTKSSYGDFAHFLRSLVGVWKRYESKRVSFTRFLSERVLPNVSSEEKNVEDDMDVEGTNLQRHFQRCTSHFLEHYASRRNSFRGPMLMLHEWLKFTSDLQLNFIFDRDTLVRVFSAHAQAHTRPFEDNEFWNRLVTNDNTSNLRIEFGISDPNTFWKALLSCASCLRLENKKLHRKARAMFLWMWRLLDAESSLDSDLVRASKQIEKIQSSLIDLSAIRRLRLASAHFCFAFIHDWRCQDLSDFGLTEYLQSC